MFAVRAAPVKTVNDVGEGTDTESLREVGAIAVVGEGGGLGIGEGAVGVNDIVGFVDEEFTEQG